MPDVDSGPILPQSATVFATQEYLRPSCSFARRYAAGRGCAPCGESVGAVLLPGRHPNRESQPVLGREAVRNKVVVVGYVEVAIYSFDGAYGAITSRCVSRLARQSILFRPHQEHTNTTYASAICAVGDAWSFVLPGCLCSIRCALGGDAGYRPRVLTVLLENRITTIEPVPNTPAFGLSRKIRFRFCA